MPEFITTDLRLVLRYASGGSFSFNRLRADAADENVYKVASAIANLQSEKPDSVRVVVTKQLF